MRLLRIPKYRWVADPEMSFGFAPFHFANLVFDPGIPDLSLRFEMVETVKRFGYLSVKDAKFFPVAGTRFYHFQQFGQVIDSAELIANSINEPNVDVTGSEGFVTYARRSGSNGWAVPNTFLKYPKQIGVCVPNNDCDVSDVANALAEEFPQVEIIVAILGESQYISPYKYTPPSNLVVLRDEGSIVSYYAPPADRFIGGICKYVCFSSLKAASQIASDYPSPGTSENLPSWLETKDYDNSPFDVTIVPIPLMKVIAESFNNWSQCCEHFSVDFYGSATPDDTELYGWSSQELQDATFGGTSMSAISDVVLSTSSVIDSVIESVGDLFD